MRFNAAEIPILLIVLSADVEIRIWIHASSSGRKNFLVTKFGLKRRLVLRLENDTLLPTIARVPVN